MRIKKIKSDGLFCYPATIAAAVKDANFLKENSFPMTLGEINLYLNSKIDNIESAINDDSTSTANTWSSQKISEELELNKLTAGTDIKIENNVISVEEDWNLAIFDTNAFNSGSLTITAPDGYIFDLLYILCHWYGNAASVASTIYGGFYLGKNTDAEKLVLRNNGTNKMGAGYITANVVNMNDISAIAYGEAYLFNNNGSAASLNNPINSYGIGRYSHTNNFKYFTIHNYPAAVTEGYCCIKYKLKKL